MNMTREDMMRELELLPVWQLKQPLPAIPILATPTLAEPAPIALTATALDVTEKAAVAMPSLQNAPLKVAALEATAAEALTEALQSNAQAEVVPVDDVPVTIMPVPIVKALVEPPITTQPVVVEKMITPWLLYCPLAAAHTEAQTLLHNMVKAMRLLSTDFVLVTDASKLTQYQANTCLLFGLPAAQHYLELQADNIETLRGQPHQQVGTCWVTYHPADLLQNPSLKRAAWQDLCAALAHHAAA